MTNKSLANFIVVSFILFFISQRFFIPWIFSIFFSLLLVYFILIAIKRLWKIAKIVSGILLFSLVAEFVLALIPAFRPFWNTHLIVKLYDISDIVLLISLAWAVITLYRANDFSKS